MLSGTSWVMTSCIITATASQIQPSWMVATGEMAQQSQPRPGDHVRWLMTMHKQSLALPNILSPNYKHNEKIIPLSIWVPLTSWNWYNSPLIKLTHGSDCMGDAFQLRSVDEWSFSILPVILWLVCANWRQVCINYYLIWNVSSKSHA